MPRKRMLDPGIWTDEGFLELSPRGRLMFIGMISTADDEGRGSASPKSLHAKIFPCDVMSDAEVVAIREEVQRHCRVRVYEVDFGEYYEMLRWTDYQTIKDPKRSTVPRFEEKRPENGHSAGGRSEVGARSEEGRSKLSEGSEEGRAAGRGRSGGPLPNEFNERGEGREGGARGVSSPSPESRSGVAGESSGKTTYAEGVTLSADEHAKLVAKHGAELTAEAIEYLSHYQRSHAKLYPSSYGAIGMFGIKAAIERREKAGKGAPVKPPPPPKKCPSCGDELAGASCLKCGWEPGRDAEPRVGPGEAAAIEVRRPAEGVAS